MKTFLQLLVFSLANMLLFSNHTLAQFGVLDVSFGTNGVKGIDYNSGSDESFATALQSDGKILVGGRTDNNNNSTDALLVRLNSDGSIDSSFGTAGRVVTNISNQDLIKGIVVQPDGKIIAGGFYITDDGHYFVMRLNADGSFDNTFGSAGIDTFGQFQGTLQSVLLQSDGKILLAGSDYTNTNKHSFLMRLKSDGSIDSTFSADGKVIYNISTQEDEIYQVILQPDGKVLACGFKWNVNTANLFAFRLKTDGSMDSTFSSDGIAVLEGTNFNGYCLALQDDGKIVVAGEGENGNNYDYLIARFHPNGNLDSSFASNGYTLFPISTQEDEVRGVGIDSAGKIVLAGTSRIPSTYMNVSLARLKTNGSLDSTFGSGGKVISDLNGIYGSESMAAVLKPNDDVITVGSYYGGSSKDFAVAQFTGKCNVDNSISTSGFTLTAMQTAARYQWLNCDKNNEAIKDDTLPSFTAKSNGRYAVAITLNGCTNTSQCVNVTGVGILDVSTLSASIYPNPATNLVNVQMNNAGEQVLLSVKNTIGVTVLSQSINNTIQAIDIALLAKGIYFIELQSSDRRSVTKLIKE